MLEEDRRTLLNAITDALAAAGYTPTTAAAALALAADGPVAKFHATASPTTSYDSAAGYTVGSLYYEKDAHKLWVCEDASEGAAVWKSVVLS